MKESNTTYENSVSPGPANSLRDGVNIPGDEKDELQNLFESQFLTPVSKTGLQDILERIFADH